MPQSRFYHLMALVALMPSCSSTNANTTTPEAQTLIGVDPADFMAAGSCDTRVLRYVATLSDVTGSDNISTSYVSLTPFVVGSSLPTFCNDPVVFGNVVAYHAYVVALDGYDRSDIEAQYQGSSAMHAGGDYVAPRWTASCHGWTAADGGSQPGLSYPNTTVILHECTRLGTEAP